MTQVTLNKKLGVAADRKRLDQLNAMLTELFGGDGSAVTALITGGTINGATVGATTPAAGSFTTLTAATSFNLNSTGAMTGVDTDGTLAANSDLKFASQKAIKTYVDARVTGPIAGDHTIDLYAFMKAAARKDALPDTPDTTALGLADTVGSVITGTTTHGGSTDTASETAAFRWKVPFGYTPASNTLSLVLRAKVSAARQVGATVAAVVKKVGLDGALGSDIVASGSPGTLTTSLADTTIVITDTGLAGGDVLDVVVTLASDDTGGSTDGYPTLAHAKFVVA